MTDKELRHLSRTDLLELLVEQTRTVETLRRQLEASNEKLEARKLSIQEAGSIADASLKINEVFEAAQRAADQYLENVRSTQYDCDNMIAQAQSNAEQILADARMQADQMLADAQSQSAQMMEQTRQDCESMVTTAQRESAEWWERAAQDLEKFMDSKVGLRELMEIMYGKDAAAKENAE
jgi:vacuolar-type H+-ATPase subunit H